MNAITFDDVSFDQFIWLLLNHAAIVTILKHFMSSFQSTKILLFTLMSMKIEGAIIIDYYMCGRFDNNIHNEDLGCKKNVRQYNSVDYTSRKTTTEDHKTEPVSATAPEPRATKEPAMGTSCSYNMDAKAGHKLGKTECVNSQKKHPDNSQKKNPDNENKGTYRVRIQRRRLPPTSIASQQHTNMQKKRALINDDDRSSVTCTKKRCRSETSCSTAHDFALMKREYDTITEDYAVCSSHGKRRRCYYFTGLNVPASYIYGSSILDGSKGYYYCREKRAFVDGLQY